MSYTVTEENRETIKRIINITNNVYIKEERIDKLNDLLETVKKTYFDKGVLECTRKVSGVSYLGYRLKRDY